MKSYIMIMMLIITPALVSANTVWPGPGKKRFKRGKTEFNYKKFYKQNAKRRCTNYTCQ
jgi:hypothetical protein